MNIKWSYALLSEERAGQLEVREEFLRQAGLEVGLRMRIGLKGNEKRAFHYGVRWNLAKTQGPVEQWSD